jgi:hypothetical protein
VTSGSDVPLQTRLPGLTARYAWAGSRWTSSRSPSIASAYDQPGHRLAFADAASTATWASDAATGQPATADCEPGQISHGLNLRRPVSRCDSVAMYPYRGSPPLSAFPRIPRLSRLASAPPGAFKEALVRQAGGACPSRPRGLQGTVRDGFLEQPCSPPARRWCRAPQHLYYEPSGAPRPGCRVRPARRVRTRQDARSTDHGRHAGEPS